MSDLKLGRAFVKIDVKRLIARVEFCEAALQASTELLRSLRGTPHGFTFATKIHNRIAANDAVLGIKDVEHYTDDQVQELHRFLDEATGKIHKLRAALRASTELLRQGAYRMVNTAPKEYHRTLDQIDANKALLRGSDGMGCEL